MYSTFHRFAAIDATRGLTFRTSATLKGLITDLMLNSGEEIALWSETEGKRVADIWRASMHPAFHCPDCGLQFDLLRDYLDHLSYLTEKQVATS